MELSDTIVAASIGAAATVVTAGFQLVSAMRASRSDTRPKNGRTVRSILSILALMVASGVGGYMFSEVRHQQTAQDLRDMRQEMNAKLLSLAAATERLASERLSTGTSQPMSMLGHVITSAAASTTKPEPAISPVSKVDSEIYASACESMTCNEATAQRSSLCGVVPINAKITQMDFFLAIPGSESGGSGYQKVQPDEDLGGARFVGTPDEYPHGADQKSACVSLLHWSERPHMARVELQYELSDSPTQLTSTPPATVVSTETPVPTLTPVSMSGPQTP